MGYLGKISAIVTANPINLQKGLSDAAASVKLFGQSVSKNIRSSMSGSEKSFSGILTQAQRLKASLDAAASNKLKFKGFAGLDADIKAAVRRATELGNVAEGINRPLASAVGKFSQMSQEIQASFMPALVAAQQRVVTLRNEINAGTRITKKNFSDVANQALAAAAAIERIAEAQQLANQTKVSKSFAFVDPASEDSLRRMALLQKQASSAPLEVRTGKSFQKAQLEVEKLSQTLVKLTADVENLRAQKKSPSDQLAKDLVNVRAKADAAMGKLSGLIPVETAVGNSADIAAKKQLALAAAIHETVVAASGAVADPFSARTRSVEKLHAALSALPDTHPMKASGLQFVGEMGTRAKVEEQGVASGATTRDQAASSAEKDIAALADFNAKLTESDAKAKALKDEMDRLAKGFAAAAEATRLFPSDPFKAQTKAAERYKAAVMALADSDPRKAGMVAGLGVVTGRMDTAKQAAESGALPTDRAEALAGRNAAALNTGADALEKYKIAAEEAAKALEKIALAASGPVADPFADRTKSVEKLKAALLTLPESNSMRAEGTRFLEDEVAKRNADAAALRGGTLTPDQARTNAASGTADIDAMTAAAKVEAAALKTVEDETNRVSKALAAAAAAARSTPIDPFDAATKSAARYREAIMRLADSDPRRAALSAELDAISAELQAASAGVAAGTMSGPDAARIAVDNTARTNTGADAIKDDGLGKAMGDSSRQSDILKGKINSLKGQLDQLDDPIRSTMIPAIEDMEAHFRSGLPAAIDAAILNARQLEATIARVQRASTIKNAAAIIDDAAITRSMGRLSGMEQVLLRVGAAAGSAAARGFDRLANATREAVQAGTIGLPATIELLNRLEREAAQAAAATGRISVGSAMAAVNRAGDVGRMGMNKFSMGLNQAMFAVDDFFSSVGGIEQKIRAVSNNVTQLGFVVGNTRGLFVALAAVVVSQVGLAFYKYINDGRSAEDVTKALNDALSRQKSLLESLTQAYDSLADSIGKSGMSDRGKKEEERKKQFDAIRKKQKEIRDEEVQSLDPIVNKERANQAKLQRELEKEETAGGRVAIQRKINESKVRENRMKDEVVAEPPKTRGQVRNLFVENEAALLQQRDKSWLRVNLYDKLWPEAVNRTVLALPKGVSKEKQVEALTIQSKELEKEASTFRAYFSFMRSTFNAQIAEIKSTIDKINSSAEEINQEALNRILPAFQGVGDVLEAGQANLKQALGEDIGSSAIAQMMDQIALDLQAQTDLAAANPLDTKIQAQVNATKAELERMANSLNEATLYIADFSDAMEKISDTLQGDLGSFQQRADKAREDDIRLGTQGTADQRKAADQDLRDAEAEKRRIENNLKHAREKEDERLAGRNFSALMTRLEAEIADPNTSADRRLAARTELDRKRDRNRDFVENTPQVMQAKAEMDNFTQDNQQKEAAIRGREAAITGEQKRAADLKTQADDLVAASREDFGGGVKGDALVQQGAEQMALAASPMLAGFRDEVMNARLQGPSRQALKVSDTTTSEGQAELQRLLRGDDAAKDINLIELQQQTASLKEIERILRVDHNIIVDL